MKKIVYAKINSTRRKEFQNLTRIVKDDNCFYVEKIGLHGDSYAKNIYENILLYSSLYKDYLAIPKLDGNVLTFPLIEGELLSDLFKKGQYDKVIEILHELLDKEENIAPFEETNAFSLVFPNITIPQGTPSYKVSNIDMILENIVLSQDGVKLIDLEWIFNFPIPKDFVIYRIAKDCMRIKSDDEFRRKLIHSFNASMDESVLEAMDQAFLNYVNGCSFVERVQRDESYIAHALNEGQKEVERLNNRIRELGLWGKGLDETVSKINSRIIELQNEVKEKNKHIAIVSKEAKENESNLLSLIETKNQEILEKDSSILSLNQRIEELGEWGKSLDLTIAGLNARIVELQNEVEEKNKHISIINEEAKETETSLSSEIGRKDEWIKERDALIASLNGKVKELGDWGKSLDKTIDGLNARIIELQNEVEEKNGHIDAILKESKENEFNLTSMVEAKDKEISEKDSSILSLNQRVEELGEWGKSLDKTIDGLNARIVELQNEVEEKNNHINKIVEESQNKEANLLNEISEKNQEIIEKDSSIASLNQRVEELLTWGKSLDETIAKLNDEILGLKNDVSEKNDKIKKIIEESKNKETELLNTINAKDSEISELSKEISSLNEFINQKNNEISLLSEDIKNLENCIQEKEAAISLLNDNVKKLEEDILKENEKIKELNESIKEKDIINASINDANHELESKIDSLETNLRTLEAEISKLNGSIAEKDNEINSQRSKIDEQLQRILILQDEEEERNIHIKKLDGEIDALRLRSNKLYEIENSTFYKFALKYYKVRDFFIPMGSKRKAFLKLFGKMIRHPIWTIRHLTPDNVRKFKKYSKSEGLARALERTDMYQDNTTEVEYSKKLELVNMKPRDEYPMLEFPKFKKVKVSIVIPVYNQFSYTYGCLVSVLKNAGDVPYEVIIGDDCSTDETKDILACVKNIVVARTKENSRFVLNNNNAAKKARGEYIYFLNNDTNVQPGFLSSLVETIESDQSIGMVGSKLVYPNGVLQEAGGILWKDGSAWNYGYKSDANASEYNYRKEADYISGAAIMIKRSLWEEIGGFDTRFVPAYYEDTDLAFEVRKHGFKVVYDPFSVVVHYEGVSNGTDITTGLKKYQVDNAKKFYEKWKDVLKDHYPNAENVFTARDRTYKKPTVLVIDHYVPTYDKDCGSRCVFGYLNLLVKMGYNVKFMGENFYRSEPYTTTLQKMGVEVLYGDYYYLNWRTWIKEVGENIDLVFFNRPHITRAFINDVKAGCPNAKLMYFGHDLHYMRLDREYEVTGSEEARKDAILWKEREWELFKKVDLVLYPSQVEIDLIKKTDPTVNAKVLQLYLFENIQKANYKFEDRKGIMFVGGFKHRPNGDGIMWFIKEVFPKILEKHPDITLTVAGSFPPQELIDCQNEHIKVTGFISDEELNKLYQKSRLIVVPLRYGAGIKGKVLEAMYNGVPTVTTSCGAEGIYTDALVVDDTLMSVNDLYDNKEKLLDLSAREYEFIKDSYSMERARESFESMVDELEDDIIAK